MSELAPEDLEEAYAKFWSKFTLPKFNYTVIDDPENLELLLFNRVTEDELLAFDFETTGLDFMRDEPIGISIANKNHSWYLSEEAMLAAKDWLKEKIESGTVLWAGHNIGFDMHFLVKLGVDPDQMKYIDTMIMQWMVNQNMSLRLKDLARTRLGITEKLASFKDILNFSKKILGYKRQDEVPNREIPLSIMGPYGALDARFTYDLLPILMEDLTKMGLLDILRDDEMPLVLAIFHMERSGLNIDKKGAIRIREEFNEKIKIEQAKWDEGTKKLIEQGLELYDGKTGIDIPGYFEEREKDEEGNWKYFYQAKPVNPNSPQQLRFLLFDVMNLKSARKTKTAIEKGEDTKSTDALTLQRLQSQDKTGLISSLINLRKYNKLVGTYLNTMIDETIDGRIYTNFNRTGTVTGRISSSGTMNFQNFPVRGEDQNKVRTIIIPGKGYILLGIDYSQIELRLLAHFSRDKNLVSAYLWGADVHQMTADRLSITRYAAKQTNFGKIYGAGPITICDQIEKDGKPRPTKTEAQRWIDGYDLAYPGVPAWKKIEISKAHSNKYVTTIGGRKYQVDGLDHWERSVVGRAERQLINAIIQGSAGDVINRAMIWIDKELRNFNARMLLQVHDELLFEVPEDAINDFTPFVQEKMEAVKDYFNISVPIIAEPKTGYAWADAKG